MPSRHDNLFSRIASFAALHAASRRAVVGKRKKPGAASFFANLEYELLTLERQLLSGQYRSGQYKEIIVRDPKLRTVSAAPFRDRVVHHALYAVIGPLFQNSFIFDSYANQVGKGTHRAIARYEHYRDHFAYVLRADIFRYFPAIDHTILKLDLRRKIACQATLQLCDCIIDGSNLQEAVDRLYPLDEDLFAPLARRRGLPLGNLTSQFFANVYLNGFDHWVKEVLRAPYLRYVDDFALFANDSVQLRTWQSQIAQYLHGRRLQLHPNKTGIFPTAQASFFLGFELQQGGRRRLHPANVTRFRARLSTLRDAWRLGNADEMQVRQRIQSWIAHARHANTVHLRHTLFKDGWFDPLWANGTSVKLPLP